MIRKYSLFSLMAVTALSLTLAACDDTPESSMPAQDETPVAEQVVEPAPTPDAVVTIVEAQNATAYATAEGATTGAIFLTLHNPQDAADRLIGASTPVATTVELHESTVDANGVAQMNKVDSIELPAHGGVTLAASGHHIMLIGLTAPLAAGSTFDVTLDFDNASDITVPVTIVSPTDPSAINTTHEGHDHGADATTDEAPADVSVEETSTPDATVPAPDAGVDASATDASADAADHGDHDHSH